MRTTILLLIYGAILCCFFACKNENDNSPQVRLPGKWKLQQSHFVAYLNGVENSDTTYNASASIIDYDQFNSDGSFTDVQLYSSGKDTIRANYTLSGTALSFSNVQNLAAVPFLLTPVPLHILGDDLVTSISTNVTQVTADKLYIHSEVTLISPSDKSYLLRDAIDLTYTRQ